MNVYVGAFIHTSTQPKALGPMGWGVPQIPFSLPVQSDKPIHKASVTDKW